MTEPQMTANPTVTVPAHADLWQSSVQWAPTELQQQQYQMLYARLVELNQQVNLTRITTPDDFWEKHLWDSLYGVMPWLVGALSWDSPDIERVIDVGTGGGFPGLPVAIACPTWSLSFLDATRKKIQAVQTLAEALDLPNAEDYLANRVEIVGHNPLHRACYDLVLIRAVGPASTCAEYALPLLNLQGIAVLYRGQWSEADSGALAPALAKLGGKLVAVRQTKTPLTGADRACLYLQKIASTETQYPRENGVPAKLPL